MISWTAIYTANSIEQINNKSAEQNVFSYKAQTTKNVLHFFPNKIAFPNKSESSAAFIMRSLIESTDDL